MNQFKKLSEEEEMIGKGIVNAAYEGLMYERYPDLKKYGSCKSVI